MKRKHFLAAPSDGFTIVELLIVIVVIAILAGIALVSYNGVQKRAQETALKSDLANAAKMMELKNAENGSYPASFPSELRTTKGVYLTYGTKTLHDGVVSDIEGGNDTGDDLNPADYPYYDLTDGVSPSDPNRNQIIAARNGVLLENICKDLVSQGYGKGPADWDANQTQDYITSCNVYENNSIQIITWQQFIDQNKLMSPVSSATVSSYITAAKNYNGGAHPSLGATVEKFMNRLVAIHALEGGNLPVTTFYDPSANQWWGVPKPTMPAATTRPADSGDTASESTTFCISGYYQGMADNIWHVGSGRPLSAGPCTP